MVLTLEDSFDIQEKEVQGYEKVLCISDERNGLQAIICIHNTLLGPALGGTRIQSYSSHEAALTDAMRLAKGMTYKSAIAGVGFGGGKSVIIADPKKQKSPEMLLSFAKVVHHLQGAYICAEDAGSTPEDMQIMNSINPYIVGLPHEKSSGNPSCFTALGTYVGIQSLFKKADNNPSVQGKKIAIQGLGSVGELLGDMLFWAGAHLIVSDIDTEKTKRLAKKWGAQIASPETILQVECDLLAPCAFGGALNPVTIANLRCRLIGGCANNQLLNDTDADEIMKKGILYAPDFVINAGGLINVSNELEVEGYHPMLARDRVVLIYDQLMQIYEIAEKNHCSTHAAAIKLGDHRLKLGIGKRKTPIYFHHSNCLLEI